MELSKLLELSEEQIKELSIADQLTYWQWKYADACIEIRKLQRDAEKNTVKEKE